MNTMMSKSSANMVEDHHLHSKTPFKKDLANNHAHTTRRRRMTSLHYLFPFLILLWMMMSMSMQGPTKRIEDASLLVPISDDHDAPMINSSILFFGRNHNIENRTKNNNNNIESSISYQKRVYPFNSKDTLPINGTTTTTNNTNKDQNSTTVKLWLPLSINPSKDDVENQYSHLQNYHLYLIKLWNYTEELLLLKLSEDDVNTTQFSTWNSTMNDNTQIWYHTTLSKMQQKRKQNPFLANGNIADHDDDDDNGGSGSGSGAASLSTFTNTTFTNLVGMLSSLGQELYTILQHDSLQLHFMQYYQHQHQPPHHYCNNNNNNHTKESIGTKSLSSSSSSSSIYYCPLPHPVVLENLVGVRTYYRSRLLLKQKEEVQAELEAVNKKKQLELVHQNNITVTDTVTHKKLTRKERRRRDKLKVKPAKIFTHYLNHIPKSGSSFALVSLSNLLWSHPQSHGELAIADKFRPCNVATTHPSNFQNQYTGHHKKHICNFWMSEHGYASKAHHNYIVLRQPQHHVLSQYFHCSESREHSNGKKMPSNLTVWLESWVEVAKMEDQRLFFFPGGNMNNTSLELMRQRNSKFFCYRPINLQSSFIWPEHPLFKEPSQEKQHQLSSHTNVSNFRYLMSPWSDMVTSEAGEALKNGTSIYENEHHTWLQDLDASIYRDLKERFDVVGDTSRMTLTVCTMFLRYTGWVAPQCDCSNIDEDTEEEEKEENDKEKSDVENLKSSQGHRRLQVRTYDATKDAHGVQHHGASYEPSKVQRQLIDKLTALDQRIYSIGKQVLDEQVLEVEAEWNVRLCRKYMQPI